MTPTKSFIIDNGAILTFNNVYAIFNENISIDVLDGSLVINNSNIEVNSGFIRLDNNSSLYANTSTLNLHIILKVKEYVT